MHCKLLTEVVDIYAKVSSASTDVSTRNSQGMKPIAIPMISSMVMKINYGLQVQYSMKKNRDQGFAYPANGSVVVLPVRHEVDPSDLGG